MLTYIEISSALPATHSVIWLHGLGADGNDFVPIVPEFNLPPDLNVRFIFPHAPIQPVTINNGYEMRAWYDITGLQRESAVDSKGILASVDSIEALIQQEINRGIPANRIILAGFSQGAVMALTVGLRRVNPLAGIIALSGYFPMAEETLKISSPTTRNTPIFLAHGLTDNVVPFGLGQLSHTLLQEAGCQVAWHTYPMDHSVCEEEIRDIREWMVRVLV